MRTKQECLQNGTITSVKTNDATKVQGDWEIVNGRDSVGHSRERSMRNTEWLQLQQRELDSSITRGYRCLHKLDSRSRHQSSFEDAMECRIALFDSIIAIMNYNSDCSPVGNSIFHARTIDTTISNKTISGKEIEQNRIS